MAYFNGSIAGLAANIRNENGVYKITGQTDGSYVELDEFNFNELLAAIEDDIRCFLKLTTDENGIAVYDLSYIEPIGQGDVINAVSFANCGNNGYSGTIYVGRDGTAEYMN